MTDDFIKNLTKAMNDELMKSYGEPTSFKLPEEEPYPEVTLKKAGMELPFTWEALTKDTRKGEYVPTGNKTLQRIGWLWGLLKYKAYRKLESSLEKSRHFQGVGGYDWEEAEYREFKQEMKWVEENSND